MRQKEQKLWDTMKRQCPRDIWLERIENLVGDGIPDVRGVSLAGVEVWFELKAPTKPKRSTTRLLGDEGTRPSQIGWHLKAAHYGMETYVLIRDSEGYLYLIPGIRAADINDMTAHDLDLISGASTWKDIWEVFTL